MIFRYDVEIDVDEKTITQKYPNYEFNFSNSKEFADRIASCWEVEGLEGNEKGLEKWGYAIKVKKSKELENSEVILFALDYVGAALTNNMQEEIMVLNTVIKALDTGKYKQLKAVVNDL